jgi:hypothetical protein
VQGSSGSGSVVKLYFDPQSGLLLRLVRYTESSLGLNPTQIDYADYRDVAGAFVKPQWPGGGKWLIVCIYKAYSDDPTKAKEAKPR